MGPENNRRSWQDNLADIKEKRFQFNCLGIGCLGWILIAALAILASYYLKNVQLF
jgi:hypothetical protein